MARADIALKPDERHAAAAAVDPAILGAAERLHAKFSVAWDEVCYAALWLAAFFNDRRDGLARRVILPQLPDWLWHEMITDTRGYDAFCRRQFCDRVSYISVEPGSDHHSVDPAKHTFVAAHQMIERDARTGHNVVEPGDHSLIETGDHSMVERDHHVIEPASTGAHHMVEPGERQHNQISAGTEHQFVERGTTPEDDFRWTLHHYLDAHGLDYRRFGWDDAGWLHPAYRLRDRRFAALGAIDVPAAAAAQIDALETTITAELADEVELLSWLPQRLERRFGFSVDHARIACLAYTRSFARSKGEEVSRSVPAAVAVAAYEHILWTAKYAAHCAAQFGVFRHWPVMDWAGPASPARTDEALPASLSDILTAGGAMTPAQMSNA